MARMTIPAIKTKAPEVEQQGPVVVGGEDAAVGPASAGLVETDDLTELGVLQPATIEQTAQTAQQSHAPLPPAQANDNIARAEELARSIVEVRAIAVEAQNSVRNLVQQAQNLAGETSLLRDMWNAGVKLPADISALPQKLADLVQSLLPRLNNIDASLASRGLPTSQSAPTIKLTQMRRLVHPARVIDGVVTLFYNPRQGENGAVDPQDFQLSRDNVRKVWCGYRLEIPAGYIADVFVGNDLISSMSGRRDSEEILSLRTNGTNLTISSGQPIARLLLRKVEAAALEIEVQK